MPGGILWLTCSRHLQHRLDQFVNAGLGLREAVGQQVGRSYFASPVAGISTWYSFLSRSA